MDDRLYSLAQQIRKNRREYDSGEARDLSRLVEELLLVLLDERSEVA